jgi:hypothetical protein
MFLWSSSTLQSLVDLRENKKPVDFRKLSRGTILVRGTRNRAFGLQASSFKFVKVSGEKKLVLSCDRREEHGT